MKQYFSLNINTKIINEVNTAGVDYAVQCLKRDMEKVFIPGHGAETVIKLEFEALDSEIFHISYPDNRTMIIGASEELGFIYGIFHVSKEILGVQPFWFWNSQVFKKKEGIIVEAAEFISKPSKIRFRGWFINDEVLSTNGLWKAARNIPG